MVCMLRILMFIAVHLTRTTMKNILNIIVKEIGHTKSIGKDKILKNSWAYLLEKIQLTPAILQVTNSFIPQEVVTLLDLQPRHFLSQLVTS